jgi:adenylate cyclase
MKAFEAYRRELMQRRMSASILLMAIPLYLSFSILDYMWVPAYWKQFFGIRVFSCCLFASFVLIAKVWKTFYAKYIVVFSHLTTAILGVGIGYMSHVTGGLASPYYAGLNWIAIGSLAFWPSPPRDRAISIATIYCGLILMEIAARRFQLDATALLSLTFMAGTCLLSILNNVLSLKALEQEFELREALQDLIRNKDQIIETKSNESANLKRLAKQFSPAVIQAIESRIISLDERNRRKVAILFIDVVDSTSRSNQLDHSDAQKALDMFFGIAIKKLMEGNLTVANFMGDGIMAIANAPYKMADFEKKALHMGLQILDSTRKSQRSFRDLWHADFKIRVGISSGYANVGFFPNTDFGVYTAVGEPVNLASRLCSAAQPNTIATTKTIISAASDGDQTFSVKKGGSISQLKGFSGHELEFYIATPPETESNAESDSLCPLCSHALVIGADLGDCIMVKCENCKYSDIQEKTATPIQGEIRKAG